MKYKEIDKEKAIKPVLDALIEIRDKLTKELEVCVKTVENIKRAKDDNKRMD